MLARKLLLPTSSSISTHPEKSGQIHAQSAIQCQIVPSAKEIRSETRPHRSAGCLGGGSVGVSSGELRFCPLDFERGGRGISIFLIISYHCLSRGKRRTNRPNPFSQMPLWSAADRNSGVRRFAGHAVALPGQCDVLAGGIWASNSADGSAPRPRKCVPALLVASGRENSFGRCNACDGRATADCMSTRRFCTARRSSVL
jgi:hypothetical protein